MSKKDIEWWQNLYKKEIPSALINWYERASEDFFEAQAAILDFMERNSGKSD